ncbi:hypothetical protein Y1Q_0022834 [Alligator mississippiensis]|uniref:Uncharacterized protein n=1 Tax=Alligator mississippiensis TaxID=8496 RepID=A0A151N587_ALLMI|nr:hypothetical protein Y1Q_0022834 [Alligator mississippiensis]
MQGTVTSPRSQKEKFLTHKNRASHPNMVVMHMIFPVNSSSRMEKSLILFIRLLAVEKENSCRNEEGRLMMNATVDKSGAHLEFDLVIISASCFKVDLKWKKHH